MDRFSSIQPGEQRYVKFDYTDRVGTATISSATVSAKIFSTGVDVTATLTTVAKQSIVGALVYVWVTGLTDGVDYQIDCTATWANGVEKLEGLILTKEIPAVAPSVETGPGRVIPPIIEPISLSELKLHLRIDHSDEDDLLTDIISMAREYTEDVTGRAFLTQTWDYCLQNWPDSNRIKLPYGKLQSVTSVKYKNDAGTETTLVANTDYIVGLNGDQCGCIFLPDGVSWPTSDLYAYNPITIRYVCGWTTAAAVPFKIKAAMKLIASDLYGNREQKVLSYGTYSENVTVKRLLNQCVLWDTFTF